MRIWFWRFHQQAKNVKRGSNITDRCNNLIRVRETARRKVAALEWLQNAKRLKLARKFMQRAFNGQKRNWIQIYFKKWRNIQTEHQFTMMTDEFEQMQQVTEEQAIEINNKKKEIEAVRSGRVHAVAKSKGLSKKVIANYVVRMSKH